MGDAQNDQIQDNAIGVDSLPRWLRDLIDYNNESAGRDTGRVRRFSLPDGDEGPDSEKEKEERRFSALMRVLQDPGYARLYQDVANAIGDADDAVKRAKAKLERESEIAEGRVDELKKGAAELPDGRKVFRSKDGRLYTEDGTDVTDKKDSVKGLSESTANWEEFKRARETAEDIERRKREVETYEREVLDPAKRKLSDPNNPPSKEELEEILRRVRGAQPADVRAVYDEIANSEVIGPDVDMPRESPMTSGSASEAKAAAPSVRESAADEYLGKTELGSPDMFAHFRAASSVVSDDAFKPQPGGPKLA